MTEEMIRLRNYSGCDEVNDGGKSYRVNRWGCVRVPEAAVAPLLRTGGFHVASPDDPSAQHSTIDDVREAAWSLPASKERATLLAILESPNSLSHLVQSIAFS
jgi:hypothetical protein